MTLASPQAEAQAWAKINQLPGKDGKIMLYCRSGRMSAIAAKRLVVLGYPDVWDLDGGMVAWEQAGYSIDQ